MADHSRSKQLVGGSLRVIARFREVSMRHMLRLSSFLTAALIIGVAAQSPAFKGGYFKATDGTTQIGLEFDSVGSINVYIDNQAFSKSSWETKSDTMVFGPVVGPEGYNCTDGARYLWALTENVLKFNLLADDCEIRSNALINLTWTRGW
jgi:hypothetical protein